MTLAHFSQDEIQTAQRLFVKYSFLWLDRRPHPFASAEQPRSFRARQHPEVRDAFGNQEIELAPHTAATGFGPSDQGAIPIVRADIVIWFALQRERNAISRNKIRRRLRWRGAISIVGHRGCGVRR